MLRNEDNGRPAIAYDDDDADGVDDADESMMPMLAMMSMNRWCDGANDADDVDGADESMMSMMPMMRMNQWCRWIDGTNSFCNSKRNFRTLIQEDSKTEPDVSW